MRSEEFSIPWGGEGGGSRVQFPELVKCEKGGGAQLLMRPDLLRHSEICQLVFLGDQITKIQEAVFYVNWVKEDLSVEISKCEM